MINRYSRPEMRRLFEDSARFNAWLEVELCAAEAFSEMGVIPRDDVKVLREQAHFDINRIYEIEQETRHDVVAFTRAVSESLGVEKRWIHYGLTSTDVVDTAYGYIYKQANEILEQGIMTLLESLRLQAIKYKDVPTIGRTHGVHADITSFGLKFALWYDEMNRQLDRFRHARKDIEAGKISGAVGNFANTPPFVQDYVCEKLGITSTHISTQVLQRDRHAYYISTLALIATSIEKMATEIRHLQRTEVREAEEYFNPGQKGSSAMPHKRNPIGSENICGMARVLRGNIVTAYENVALWHERDISHSSAERVILPDSTIGLDYMLHRFNKILSSLDVFPETMKENMNKTYGLIYSQRLLLKLINTGMSREKAYDMVQKLTAKSWNEHVQFRELVDQSEIANILPKAEIDDAFDYSYHLRHLDEIYRQVGIE